jgi:hypothetical protein
LSKNPPYKIFFSGLTFSKTNTKEKDDGLVRWPVSFCRRTHHSFEKKASFSLEREKEREREGERLLNTFSLAII